MGRGGGTYKSVVGVLVEVLRGDKKLRVGQPGDPFLDGEMAHLDDIVVRVVGDNVKGRQRGVEVAAARLVLCLERLDPADGPGGSIGADAEIKRLDAQAALAVLAQLGGRRADIVEMDGEVGEVAGAKDEVAHVPGRSDGEPGREGQGGQGGEGGESHGGGGDGRGREDGSIERDAVAVAVAVAQ